MLYPDEASADALSKKGTLPCVLSLAVVVVCAADKQQGVAKQANKYTNSHIRWDVATIF